MGYSENMLRNIRKFKADCQSILPVRARVVVNAAATHIWFYGMACDGLTQMGHYTHIVRLTRKPSRGFWEILAHEWAHLHVDENWRNVQHGPVFQEACHKLANGLKAKGWKLGPLYDLKLDKKEAKHRVRKR